MATSISSAQRSLLATGDLDSLGSSRGEELVLTETEKALAALAGMLVTAAAENLRSSGQNSSGALASSFVSSLPIVTADGLIVEVRAAPYYDFPNKGVRGTRSGSSSAGYAFKTENPSKAMVKDIEKWLNKSKKATSNTSKNHTISQHEAKAVSISELDSAYTTARAIKMHGIKGSGYFDKAVAMAEKYAQENFGEALAIDIINSLPKKL